MAVVLLWYLGMRSQADGFAELDGMALLNLATLVKDDRNVFRR